ncbi:MAG: hypothetical protein OEZ68_12925 [Gammaproteobacteria bacterium]|nr:hypothetical protein [Gammaproteobacteria bacterium]MDH5801701.1 hypothetical protein [Gammaproteobacteria bacterium]
MPNNGVNALYSKYAYRAICLIWLFIFIVISGCEADLGSDTSFSASNKPFAWEMQGLIDCGGISNRRCYFQVVNEAASRNSTPLHEQSYDGSVVETHRILVPLESFSFWNRFDVFTFVDENDNTSYDNGEPQTLVCNLQRSSGHSITLEYFQGSTFSRANPGNCNTQTAVSPWLQDITLSTSAAASGTNISIVATTATGSSSQINTFEIRLLAAGFSIPSQTLRLNREGNSDTWTSNLNVNLTPDNYLLLIDIDTGSRYLEYVTSRAASRSRYRYVLSAGANGNPIQEGDTDINTLYLNIP